MWYVGIGCVGERAYERNVAWGRLGESGMVGMEEGGADLRGKPIALQDLEAEFHGRMVYGFGIYYVPQRCVRGAGYVSLKGIKTEAGIGTGGTLTTFSDLIPVFTPYLPPERGILRDSGCVRMEYGWN